MFWKKDERKLLKQIDEFARFKKGYTNTASTQDREWLLKLAKFTDAEDITDLTEDDVDIFLDHFSEYFTPYSMSQARKSIRCFLRYHRSRGYPVSIKVSSV